jgi:hypothetical protein
MDVRELNLLIPVTNSPERDLIHFANNFFHKKSPFKIKLCYLKP